MTLERAARAWRRTIRRVAWVALAVIVGSSVLAAMLPPARNLLAIAELGGAPAPSALPVPVDGVRTRQIANTWGAPRSGGRTHKGVDIFAPRGTPVRSTTRGVVLRVGTVDLGGRAVSVLGPGLHVHYYAHFDRFGTFAPGDTVQPGDILGYVGDSGNARGTPFHLHYGVYTPVRGAINPWPMLRDRPARGTTTAEGPAPGLTDAQKAPRNRKPRLESPSPRL